MNDRKVPLPQSANDNTSGSQRRRFPRRKQDVCMVNVDGHPYPVTDWSLCGVLFEGDTRPFDEGQHVNMIMRFKTENGIEDVKITGRIVRKNAKAVATEFDNLPTLAEESFHRVIKEKA